MATANGLNDLGVPPEVAKRTGYQEVSVTTAGTTQGSTGGVLSGPGNKLVLATIHSSNGAVTLPANAEKGDEIIVANVTGTAGLVFPQSGGNINGNTTDSGTATLAAQGSAGSNWRFVKLNATRWAGWSGADQS